MNGRTWRRGNSRTPEMDTGGACGRESAKMCAKSAENSSDKRANVRVGGERTCGFRGAGDGNEGSSGRLIDDRGLGPLGASVTLGKGGWFGMLVGGSEVFKSACPRSYSYAYDDATSTFTCTAGDYSITFCPRSGPRYTILLVYIFSRIC